MGQLEKIGVARVTSSVGSDKTRARRITRRSGGTIIFRQGADQGCLKGVTPLDVPRQGGNVKQENVP